MIHSAETSPVDGTSGALIELKLRGGPLVDRMAHRWGIERGDDTATVWFELSSD